MVSVRIKEITPSSATWEEYTLVSIKLAFSIHHNSITTRPSNESDLISLRPPSWQNSVKEDTTSPGQFPTNHRSSQSLHPITRDLIRLKSRLANFSCNVADWSFLATSMGYPLLTVILSKRMSRICHSAGKPSIYRSSVQKRETGIRYNTLLFRLQSIKRMPLRIKRSV